MAVGRRGLEFLLRHFPETVRFRLDQRGIEQRGEMVAKRLQFWPRRLGLRRPAGFLRGGHGAEYGASRPAGEGRKPRVEMSGFMDIMENMDIRRPMRSFTTHDLNKQVGDVTDAATKAPVVITRHRKPRFVMMSYEHYQRLAEAMDPRRAYGPGETPDGVADLLSNALERLASGEGYGDEP